jgi:hypothetical protein
LGSVIVDMNDTTNTTQPQLSKLAAFRQALYTCFLKAGDVLFEMIDALLLSPRLASFPELSCVPVFRHQWPSLYEGLQDGQVDQAKLFETLTEQLPENERSLLAGDLYGLGAHASRALFSASADADQRAKADHHLPRLQHAGSGPARSKG